MSILHKLFQKTTQKTRTKAEEEGIFRTHSVWPYYSDTKNKAITRKLETNIPYEYRCKSLPTIQKQIKIQQHIKRTITPLTSGIYPRNRKLV